MHRDVAAVGVGFALVLAVEDHLGERDGEDRQDRGQDVGGQAEREPQGADDDDRDLGERIRRDVGDPGGNLAADPLEGALLPAVVVAVCHVAG